MNLQKMKYIEEVEVSSEIQGLNRGLSVGQPHRVGGEWQDAAGQCSKACRISFPPSPNSNLCLGCFPQKSGLKDVFLDGCVENSALHFLVTRQQH